MSPMKYVFLFLSLLSLFSCSNEKENILLEVLKAIDADNIASIEHLCTPEGFEQINQRAPVLQYMLSTQWNLSRYHPETSNGNDLSECYICDEFDDCTTIDLFLLVNKDGKWLIDYKKRSLSLIVERFLGHLEKMDFDAAIKISGRRLRKELREMKAAVAFYKESGAFNQEEKNKLFKHISNTAYFRPSEQWIQCEDDSKYRNTKYCLICNPLMGCDNAIRITKMRDKKWYIEYYDE